MKIIIRFLELCSINRPDFFEVLKPESIKSSIFRGLKAADLCH